MKQTEIANELKKSTSTIQRYRRQLDMLPPYRISPNTNYTRKQKTPNTNLDDVKMTSNDLKMISNDLKTTTSNEPVKHKKNRWKGGSVHEKIKINDQFLDETLHYNNS